MTKPLDRTRWEKVEALLDAVLDLSAEQRAVLLASACAGDPELRREVEGLLAADTASAGFLAHPADPSGELLRELVAERDDLEVAAHAGERLGPFVIRHEIGRGGMGAVFLAERADGEFEQRVAIKLLKRGSTAGGTLIFDAPDR